MKIDRLISIILFLLEHKKVGAKELADTFEVSLRTIYRDIETINMSGIPIVSTSGVNGGFEIMEGYKLDKKVFSASDIITILRGLESVSALFSSDEIIRTFVKVQSLIPNESAEDIALQSNQVLIDLQPWHSNPKLQSYLKQINEALRGRNRISFSYFDRSGQSSEREIEPARLVLKGNSWYVQGFCLDKNDFRLFKLSRMADLHIESERYSAREIPPATSDFIEMMDKKQTTVKLLIHESVRDRAVDYCGIENIIPHGEHHFIALLPFIDDDSGYNHILSFGDKCECLEPAEVRQELIRRIKNLSKVYLP